MRLALIIVLRVFGAIDLLALAAVFMPQEWMAAGHRWAGLGELSREPLVGYLARSTSAVYALHGALILFISFDIDRYWNVIRFLAAAALMHGAVLVWIDLAEGMPLWWTILEGPCLIGTGATVLVLQRLAGRPVRSS